MKKELKFKSNLDSSETEGYLDLVKECYILAYLAEGFIQSLPNGSVLPFDPID
jgi:hypothetical protein